MNQRPENDEMRSEYDFSDGVRGKHHHSYHAGTNIVVLDPEVARVFPDSESVNRALRMLIELAESEARKGPAKDSSEA